MSAVTQKPKFEFCFLVLVRDTRASIGAKTVECTIFVSCAMHFMQQQLWKVMQSFARRLKLYMSGAEKILLGFVYKAQGRIFSLRQHIIKYQTFFADTNWLLYSTHTCFLYVWVLVYISRQMWNLTQECYVAGIKFAIHCSVWLIFSTVLFFQQEYSKELSSLPSLF